ncbi:zinc transporter ZIP13 isoform X3 [Elephas maximus indicus]|uniref:zinc transporter ZIP13 isoform X3 n=1 Tax=Elephas maximus indicus TaxID=99487 RepID=UPI00211640A1|nr:zinc transporter ZIP13 isoform X3 [Elephas maximus indicus]
MPGCPCPGCGMAGQRLIFLTALALELLGGAGGSQPALRSRGPAAACRLDNKETGARRLKQLLSFALGGLLGNVFLHLLPEAWAYTCSSSPGGEGQSLQQQQQLGLWVIAGFLTFLVLEKMFLDSKEKEGPGQAPSKDPVAAAATPAPNRDRCLAQPAAESGPHTMVRSIKVSGYLNLLANTIDNFTHGLAVAASFLVSKKIGLLTTMAILLHEIPHEVGDFVILLRAGFDRWSAAKLQLSTALGGLLGACFAICTQSPKGRRPWPGSCLSPLGASSTLPWSTCCRTSWRKTTRGPGQPRSRDWAASHCCVRVSGPSSTTSKALSLMAREEAGARVNPQPYSALTVTPLPALSWGIFPRSLPPGCPPWASSWSPVRAPWQRQQPLPPPAAKQQPAGQ